MTEEKTKKENVPNNTSATKEKTSIKGDTPEDKGKKDSRGGAGAGAGGRFRRTAKKPWDRKNSPGHDGQAENEFEERVVAVNRCAKVVKGGRRFSFSALLIIGDKKGKVGHGLGKAKEVPEAIRKAKVMAQNNLIQVSLDGGTIPHEIIGEHDAGKILFKPAAEGTGVKAAGACRSILEMVGVRNILTKSLRGNNPHNIVKATINALKNLRSAQEVAQVRGVEVKRVRLKK